MANKNLYAPYGGQKKTPHARQVTVKPGTVKAQKTQKVNPALYGGEDSIKPEASTSGHWVRGKDHQLLFKNDNAPVPIVSYNLTVCNK